MTGPEKEVPFACYQKEKLVLDETVLPSTNYSRISFLYSTSWERDIMSYSAGHRLHPSAYAFRASCRKTGPRVSTYSGMIASDHLIPSSSRRPLDLTYFCR